LAVSLADNPLPNIESVEKTSNAENRCDQLLFIVQFSKYFYMNK
jgi:hypothetical protein